MADNLTLIKNLAQTVQHQDPQLYAAIMQMATDLYNLQNQINPPSFIRTFAPSGVPTEQLIPATNFRATLYPINIQLSWDKIDAQELPLYELRMGSVWETAEYIGITANSNFDVDPIGHKIGDGVSYTFILRCLGIDGKYSLPVYTTLTVPEITTPTVTAQVIGNFVLLSWDRPISSFAVNYYRVFRYGIEIGNVYATFKSLFELTGGVYEYHVRCRDVVGNESSDSNAVILTLSDPTDFIRSAILTSTWSGAKENCRIDIDGKLLVPINTTETYSQHFITNGWNTPQDQVDAGYELYIEPSKTSGIYEEIFDFVDTYTNTIVNLDWNYEAYDGSVSINPVVEVSDDGITYDPSTVGTSRFALSVRFVRVTIAFTSSPPYTSLIGLFNFRVALDVKRDSDGGTVNVFAADAAGTTVLFNKAFKYVDVIQLTPMGTVQLSAIFDFDGGESPTEFKVFLFNSTGIRTDGVVSWTAGGIL